jgi:catechol 2,3-dioxygenase-like lactoylglutathione lyase family enzyme
MTMPEAKAARTKFEHADPILSVASMARSLKYYVDVLGFRNAAWGGDDFTCVTRDGASIYLCAGGQGQPGTWVWLGVEDVDALHDEYRQTGATILRPPENFPWAREMRVGDPDSHVLRFGSDPKENA